MAMNNWIDRVCQDIMELPDRTSPAEYPEMMLVTPDEVRMIIEQHQPRGVIDSDIINSKIMRESFPYFRIAKVYNVRYSDVLSLVDYVHGRITSGEFRGYVPGEAIDEIHEAYGREGLRRDHIKYGDPLPL